MRRVFLSYRRDDTQTVTSFLYQYLEDSEAFGPGSVFMDVDDIPDGADFREVLGRAVGSCEFFLAVIGKQWVTPRLMEPTDFVRIEIEAALQRNIPVAPVLVDGAPMPRADQLPPSLHPLLFRHGRPIRPGKDFRPDVLRMVDGLRRAARLVAEDAERKLFAAKDAERLKLLTTAVQKPVELQPAPTLPAPMLIVRPSLPRPTAPVVAVSGSSTILDYQLTDGTRVRAVLPAAACAEMVDHAKESKRRMVEVGGFLMGTVEKMFGLAGAPTCFLITVTDVLMARTFSESSAQVMFGLDVWQSLTKEAVRLESAGEKHRLGWYHTHPNQGIYFSLADAVGHMRWQEPFQIGLVIDPQKMECGLMFWKEYPPDPNVRASVLHESLGGPILFSLLPAGNSG